MSLMLCAQRHRLAVVVRILLLSKSFLVLRLHSGMSRDGLDWLISLSDKLLFSIEKERHTHRNQILNCYCRIDDTETQATIGTTNPCE